MIAYDEFNEADFVKPDQLHRIALINQHRREHGHPLPKVASGIQSTCKPDDIKQCCSGAPLYNNHITQHISEIN